MTVKVALDGQILGGLGANTEEPLRPISLEYCPKAVNRRHIYARSKVLELKGVYYTEMFRCRRCLMQVIVKVDTEKAERTLKIVKTVECETQLLDSLTS